MLHGGVLRLGIRCLAIFSRSFSLLDSQEDITYAAMEHERFGTEGKVGGDVDVAAYADTGKPEPTLAKNGNEIGNFGIILLLESC